MSTTSADGSARLAVAATWLALALGLAGCVSQETKRDAINDINAAFKVEYESILKENGTHRVGRNPVATHEAMIAALQQLGMVVTQQSRDLGFIAVEAPAPSPLTRAEWDRAAAADLPKAREILRRHIGSLAELVPFRAGRRRHGDYRNDHRGAWRRADIAHHAHARSGAADARPAKTRLSAADGPAAGAGQDLGPFRSGVEGARDDTVIAIRASEPPSPAT